MHSTAPSLSLLTLLLLLLSHIPFSTPLPANLPSFPSIHSSLLATRPSCAILAQFPAWYQPSARFDPGDCPKAIDLFYSDYVKDHEGARYEYLASGVDPVHDIPTQRVPLRVAVGTCTVVIAMRSQFLPGQLPNETPFKSARSDISSFRTLYHGVREIDAACSAKESQPGWYETGDLSSIGVFIFQSGSEINRDLHAGRGGLGGNLNLTSISGLGGLRSDLMDIGKM